MSARSVLRRAAPAALVLGITVCAAPAQATVPFDVDGDVAALRAAVDKYKDVKVAVADGFQPTDDCVSSPTGEGVMGYHYVHPQRLSAPIDLTKPPILVYQPAGDGGRKLVAVEYLKPDADQNLATKDDQPSLFGRPFDGPMEGHAPGMPKHYDLHAWIYQDNPDGMFAAYNPAGSCKVSGTQVSKVPTGGAQTGAGSTAGGNAWLVAFGAAAMAAGAGVLASARRIAGRRH